MSVYFKNFVVILHYIMCIICNTKVACALKGCVISAALNVCLSVD